MQQSDVEGIKHDGARASERGTSFFENPHYSAPENWLELSSAWLAGWREADKGRNEMLVALDRIRYW